MSRFVTVIALAVICCFAADLYAQVGAGRNKNKNTYKKANEQAQKAGAQQAKKAQKNAEKEEREEEREEAKEEREAKRNGGEEEDGIGIVGGEAGDAAAEPGSVIPKAVKEETLEKIMDDLKLEDKAKRSKFKSNVRDAWEDCEKEDKRYSIVYKRYLENDDKLAAEKKVHQGKLEKIWEDSDEKLAKDEVLTEAQMATWKKTSTELREKTATDRYYEPRNNPSEEPTKKEKKDDED